MIEIVYVNMSRPTHIAGSVLPKEGDEVGGDSMSPPQLAGDAPVPGTNTRRINVTVSGLTT